MNTTPGTWFLEALGLDGWFKRMVASASSSLPWPLIGGTAIEVAVFALVLYAGYRLGRALAEPPTPNEATSPPPVVAADAPLIPSLNDLKMDSNRALVFAADAKMVNRSRSRDSVNRGSPEALRLSSHLLNLKRYGIPVPLEDGGGSLSIDYQRALGFLESVAILGKAGHLQEAKATAERLLRGNTDLTPAPWGSVSLSLFGFVSESPSIGDGTRVLRATVKVTKAVHIQRIEVLWQRKGQNGNFALQIFESEEVLASGVERPFIVLHTRPHIGAFWGEPTADTKLQALDDLDQAGRDRYVKRLIGRNKQISCRIVIVAEGHNEISHDFTICTGGVDDVPQIVDPDWCIPYAAAESPTKARRSGLG
ncbi:hypothetical protein FHS82_001012 [Pseudochelatococcus lubricantis]|uniref:Uncharacterized protein n=1 Tax=Pseudochelatococcus lubricantis TaxID=1538102 RepID=A0ABX0V292_9HYPH|nr:hypothetical protein [Pseudochelatococcus lubricantis]NIJ57186.1 hypothetical protein [Pseudochelatococcus lubricantis]